MVDELEKRVKFLSYLLPAADKKDREKMRLVISKLQNEIKLLRCKQTSGSSIKGWIEAVDEFLSPQYLKDKYINKDKQRQ